MSGLYVLSQDGNNLQLGWGTATLLAEDEYSGYEVCIEPVQNPSAYNIGTYNSDVNNRTLEGAVNRELSNYFRIGVATFIEGTDKTTQYSTPKCDLIDLGESF